MGRKPQTSIYRAIDANVNRACEGVRVVEDLVRFHCDDADLARGLRSIRHALREGVKKLPGGEHALLRARDSRGDAARNAPPVTGREDAGSLITANLRRAQEASRVLEEYSKLLSPAAASHFGEIRFRLYDTEKNLSAVLSKIQLFHRMPRKPFLYAIAGYSTFAGTGSFSFLKALIEAETGMIQLREKDATDAAILKMARKIGKATAGTGSIFVVNDRPDIAIAADADAVHVGQDELPVGAVRVITSGNVLIGLSTHSYKQAAKGLAERPDYISVGPVFSSPTKPDKKAVGLKLLKRVAKESGDIPVVAIGGVTPENMKKVFDAGASGAAMISSLSGARNLPATLGGINSILEEYR